ncbi:MAG: hypothetical protein NXI08_13055 [bacterium]|nr:hypothetical protein [bacterium]
MIKTITLALILLITFVINLNAQNTFPNYGNAGIWTTSPQEALHINGSVRGNQSGALRISTGYGYMDIGPKNTNWAHFNTDRPRFYFDKEIRINTGYIGSYDENLYLRTSGSTRMTINNSNGYVGIGTSSPTYKLDVIGDIGVSQYLRHNDDTNTYVRFQSDDLQFYAGGDQVLRADEDSSPTLTFGSVWDTKFNGSALFIGGTQGSNNGKVGIGTANPDYKLTVAGTISSREIIVEETAGADFVFEENYDLPTLGEIESFIQKNKHLPGIAPASQMIEEGVKVGELQIQLLQKIEELTLHVIEINKENQVLRKEIEHLKQANK